MVEIQLGGPCCFCGEPIEHTAVDPCAVSVETEEGMTQAWFCHARCFKARLATGRGLEPVHL
jgi:hypothetical protein